MASPRVGQRFASPQAPLPGQGKNVALEALSEAADRQVQRDQTTAQMQIEAMRSSTEAAKMQVAAASDMSRGITEASQAFATQKENQRREGILVAEAQKARDSQASRERTQQAADQARQDSVNEATKVNNDASRALDRSEAELKRKDTKDATKANQLQIHLARLMQQLGDPTGVPQDKEEAVKYLTDLEVQSSAVNDQLVELGYGQSKTALARGFNIMAASSLARHTTVQGKIEKSKRKEEADTARTRDLRMRDSSFKIQGPLFEQQEVWRLIDAGTEKMPPEEKAVQLFMLLSKVDHSNLKPGSSGIGLVQALAMNEGKPAELINQVMAKLGPHGMASADALIQTIQGFPNALGETDDTKTMAYRRAVVGIMGNMAAVAPRQIAYSAIQNGYAVDKFDTWFNAFREQTGEPPNEQEQHNFIRGIDASHLPGNMDIGKLFAVPSEDMIRFGELRSGARQFGESSPEEEAAEQAEALVSPPPTRGPKQSPHGRKIGLRGIGQSAIRATQALTSSPGVRRGPFRP